MEVDGPVAAGHGKAVYVAGEASGMARGYRDTE